MGGVVVIFRPQINYFKVGSYRILAAGAVVRKAGGRSNPGLVRRAYLVAGAALLDPGLEVGPRLQFSGRDTRR